MTQAAGVLVGNGTNGSGCCSKERIIAGPASTAGWCRRRRSRSTCASAWPTASRCSGCRCRRRIGITEPRRLPGGHGLLRRALRHQLRLEDLDARLDVHAVLRLPRPGRGALGRLARTRRPAQGRRRRGAVCWCGGLVISALGIYSHQFWLMWLGSGVIGGIGLGPRLHLARLHPDQVVPGPARHGDRHGDHGLRRRRDDRRAAGRQADEALRHPDLASACGRPSSRWPRSTSSS